MLFLPMALFQNLVVLVKPAGAADSDAPAGLRIGCGIRGRRWREGEDAAGRAEQDRK